MWSGPVFFGPPCIGSVLDGSKIEVVLSKPVDRETYQYVKSAKAAAQVTYVDSHHRFVSFLLYYHRHHRHHFRFIFRNYDIRNHHVRFGEFGELLEYL